MNLQLHPRHSRAGPAIEPPSENGRIPCLWNNVMTGPNPSRGKVLVADGEESIRSSLAVALGQAGLEVMETSEGSEALWLIQEGRVEVAVLGEQLGRVPAQELLRQSMARRARVPIILCSASWDAEHTSRAVREGAWDCLSRPCTEIDLLGAVFQALRARRAGHAQAEAGLPAGAHVGVRTREELLWQVVQKAQKMETAGLLAGSVVHDLNNLLTVVLGYSDIVQRSLPAGSASWTFVEEIRRAANGGAALVRELMAVGRKSTDQPQPLDLNAILTRMSSLLRQVAGPSIKTEMFLEPGLGLIRADPGEIDQVILNLVLNARDAINAAGRKVADGPPARLTLRTANLELASWNAEHPVPPGLYVVLQVSDTGCGMSAETLARLFEPFYTTKRAGQGTGLGLATVHEVLRRLGGQITVRSELGLGSTFTTYLPRLDSAARTAPRPQSETTTGLGTETVLLLEDDPAVRDLFHRVLESRGYQVLLAITADDAHKIAANHAGPLDLLIAGLVLREMDGVQLARQIAALRPKVRVLFTTGNPLPAQVQEAEAFPRAKVLNKPLAPTTLLAEMRELLNRGE